MQNGDRLDTGAFSDVAANVTLIKESFETNKNLVTSAVNNLLENWSGDAKDKFKIYYDGIVERMTMNMETIEAIATNINESKKAYEEWDNSLKAQFVGEENQ